MEVAGLALGVAGLVGLFSACLDAAERIDSWKHSGEESRILSSFFEAEKLLLEKWGEAVGLDDDAKIANDDHHEALDDPQIFSRVREHLSLIKELYSNADDPSLPVAVKGSGPGRQRLFPKGLVKLPSSILVESKRQRGKWALKDKEKCTEQVGRLKQFVQDLYNLVPLHGVKTKAEIRKELHTWLLGRHIPNELYDYAVQKRLNGTCGWILKHISFLDWASPGFPAGSAKLLWINGPAGFGKTVLCARVVEYLSSTHDTPTAHFFFSSDFESRKDPFAAVRSWLAQLLPRPAAFKLVRAKWEAQDAPIATRADIVRLLQEVAHAIPGCTFVIDGLDECDDARGLGIGGSSPLVVFLETIQRVIADTTTRIMIASRDAPEIRQCFTSNTRITLFKHTISPEDVQPDIESYSRSIVDRKLSDKGETAKGDISQKLARRCEGQFLWLTLQEGSLRSGKNKKQLEAAIDKTPTGLDRLYDRSWEKILSLPDEEDRARAFSLLRWAAFAVRPLTVSEITEAVLIDDDCNEAPVDGMPDSINQSYIDGEILGLCGSLIEVRSVASETNIGMRTVHLTHFSVKEYLIRRISDEGSRGNNLLANERLRPSNRASQHNVLAAICLRYLNFPSVWQNLSEETGQALGTFRDYAAGSWYIHAFRSQPGDFEVVRLINELFEPTNKNWQSWGGWFGQKGDLYIPRGYEVDPAAIGPLYYALRFRLMETFGFLITERKCSINHRTPWGATPLALSCNFRSIKAVEMLLNEGADLTIADDFGMTPLHLASEWSHSTEAAKMLLDKGADITATNKRGSTPIQVAAGSGGFIEMVKLLLEKGADSVATDGQGRTLLHLASSSGKSIELVKLLLKMGANVMATDNERGTALHLASASGRSIKVVKLLLEEGGDIMAMDDSGNTPLHLASLRGRSIDVVRLLLERGGDIMAINKGGDTPLHAASRWGESVEVVKLLLEKGVDIMARNNEGDTPLHMASRRRDGIEVLGLLLERGADIMATNNDGDTPLITACKSSSPAEALKMLLEGGADIMARDIRGRAPLQLVTHRRNSETLKLLLEKGAEMMVTDIRGQTPLHLVSYFGLDEVVKMFLERGANTEAGDADGRTALFYALILGHLETANVLLSHNASVNTKDRYGATPLFVAVRNGHEKHVKSLLSIEGALVDFDDGLGRSLLWWASKSGNSQVIDAIRQLAHSRGIQICHDDLAVEPTSGLETSESLGWWCDACTRKFWGPGARYHCSICSGDDFEMCLDCFEMGARCRDDSHELVLRTGGRRGA